MATKVSFKTINNVKGIKSLIFKRQPLTLVPCRSIVYSESGAILPKPPQTRFFLIKVICTVVPFLYVGSQISKSGAAFLEENEIFVPDDDDD